jgi:hypothetical protein
MKKIYLVLLLTLITIKISYAQTKVFKEVSDGISTALKPILQDGALIGYLSFSELERVNEDSFSYKITIMDENLNDIGIVKFRELKLNLQAVSFEKDTLCLAYLKSNAVGYEYKNRKERKTSLKNGYLSAFTQFISLTGNITHTFEKKINVNMYEARNASPTNQIGRGALKNSLQLRNISGVGFACFYGDKESNYILVFNSRGKLTWEKHLDDKTGDFYMMTSGHDIYLLMKKNFKTGEGGYELTGYNTDDRSTIIKSPLEDKQGNELRVMAFDNDPATGKPYLSGYIINEHKSEAYVSVKGMTRGVYNGVFTISLNGHKKEDVKEVYTYWNDRSKADISARGHFNLIKGYIMPNHSFKDYNGNTYFTGSTLIRKTRWGAISSSIITAPLILPPIFILGNVGTKKFKITDGAVLKLNAAGTLSCEKSVPATHSKFLMGNSFTDMAPTHDFYTVSASETKSMFLIMNDTKNTTIYNVNQQKVLRTIPHKDGKIYTTVHPAKEGHIIVSEYNRKEKTTRYSIEAI